jgi:hypothetical protein
MSKRLALRLVLPFLTLGEVGEMLYFLTKEELQLYFVERFTLRKRDATILMNGLDIYPALMDRLVCHEQTIERIITSRFILDTRLRARMYLAVKYNNNALMHYYNDNHYILNGGKENVSLSANDVDGLLELPFPFEMDGRKFEYYPREHQVKIHVANVVICIVDLFEKKAIIVLKKGAAHDDIRFMIRNIEYLKTVLVYKDDSTKRKGLRRHPPDNGHRRPKIRRRHLVGGL